MDNRVIIKLNKIGILNGEFVKGTKKSVYVKTVHFKQYKDIVFPMVKINRKDILGFGRFEQTPNLGFFSINDLKTILNMKNCRYTEEIKRLVEEKEETVVEKASKNKLKERIVKDISKQPKPEPIIKAEKQSKTEQNRVSENNREKDSKSDKKQNRQEQTGNPTKVESKELEESKKPLKILEKSTESLETSSNMLVDIDVKKEIDPAKYWSCLSDIVSNSVEKTPINVIETKKIISNAKLEEEKPIEMKKKISKKPFSGGIKGRTSIHEVIENMGKPRGYREFKQKEGRGKKSDHEEKKGDSIVDENKKSMENVSTKSRSIRRWASGTSSCGDIEDFFVNYSQENALVVETNPQRIADMFNKSNTHGVDLSKL